MKAPLEELYPVPLLPVLLFLRWLYQWVQKVQAVQVVLGWSLFQWCYLLWLCQPVRVDRLALLLDSLSLASIRVQAVHLALLLLASMRVQAVRLELLYLVQLMLF